MFPSHTGKRKHQGFDRDIYTIVMTYAHLNGRVPTLEIGKPRHTEMKYSLTDPTKRSGQTRHHIDNSYLVRQAHPPRPCSSTPQKNSCHGQSQLAPVMQSTSRYAQSTPHHAQSTVSSSTTGLSAPHPPPSLVNSDSVDVGPSLQAWFAIRSAVYLFLPNLVPSLEGFPRTDSWRQLWMVIAV